MSRLKRLRDKELQLYKLFQILDADRLKVDTLFCCSKCWSYRDYPLCHEDGCDNRYDFAEPIIKYKEIRRLLEK